MALGAVDYGLMGLIGGLSAFISFFNSLMATAVGRFFAFSIGAAEGKGDEGIEECRQWFNVALLIHTIVPFCLLAIGYPTGVWAINNFLTIPADRITDCIWVWRFVCISCFLSMVSVPFNAIYVAKQYIAELTIYTIVTVTINAMFLYYMVSHPGQWLVKLSLWSCLLAILPQMLIATRALWLFPECRVVPRYMLSRNKIKEISVYAFYRFFGALGVIVKRQGLDILVNKVLGPAKNAAVNVGGSVSGHANSLSGAFLTALSPAITTAYGARDYDRFKKMSLAACKIAAAMILIFAVPLFLEADEVFRIWLVNPPEGCVSICIGLLVTLVIENMSCGYCMAIYAHGDINSSQVWYLIASTSAVPMVWAFMVNGFGIASVAYGLVLSYIFILGVRLFYARKLCAFSIRKWMCCVALPVSVCVTIALGVAIIPRLFIEPSFTRVVITTVFTNAILLPLCWFLLFDVEERSIVLSKIKSFPLFR